MMKKILTVFFLACLSCAAMAQDNVIDEIVWVVGDDAILRICKTKANVWMVILIV